MNEHNIQLLRSYIDPPQDMPGQIIDEMKGECLYLLDKEKFHIVFDESDELTNVTMEKLTKLTVLEYFIKNDFNGIDEIQKSRDIVELMEAS